MADPTLPIATALLLPLLSFLLLGVIAPLRRLGRGAGYVSLLLSCGALAGALLGWQRTFPEPEPIRLLTSWLPAHAGPLASVGLLIDHASTMMLVLVALVSCLVQAYSLGYLHDEPRASLGRYYAYQSLFAFSMMGLVLAPNLLQLFICWELVGLCSYLLIGFWYQRPAAARAAVKAFWTTKAGDVGLLIGIVLLWRHAGTLELLDLRLLAESGRLAPAGLSVITFCLYLGAAGKSAQFPFHIWLPDAMEGPTPVSALIHAATMVTAGVYLLFRTEWLFALTPDVLLIVAFVGAFTALMAAVLACVQTDIKKVLAYSTVSQLGYMMAAIGSGAAHAGFFHLLTHGVFKALLFLGAGAVIHAVGSNEITHMGGLARRMPQTVIIFVIGTLSLAGMPFFGGFLSKEEILAAVWAGGHPVLCLVLLVAAFLTAFYMFRVVFLTFFGVPSEGRGSAVSHHAAATDGPPHSAPHAHDPPLIMAAPLWLLAIVSMAIGLYFTWQHPAPEFAAAARDTVATVPVPGWLSPLAVVVASSGILLAWLTYQRRTIDATRLAAAFGPIRHAALARFWIDDVVMLAYRGGLLAGARAIGWVDRYLVDGVVNALSAAVVMGADRGRRVQTGRVQDYLYGVALGLLALITWIGWAR
ncbi:MAG: NADH-quinone oxidoreductase subunit L [Vicinamibacterales bacterium]